MSVFGGDSWGREAQYRKRRVDDLLSADSAIDDAFSSTFKKLSNGQYACLICPQNPVLHSPLVFSTHCKGLRHRAAESKLKERELARRDEASKRTAIGETFCGTAKLGTCNRRLKLPDYNPLIEQTGKAKLEYKRDCQSKSHSKKSCASHVTREATNSMLNVADSSLPAAGMSDKVVAQWNLDYRERRERELKFTAAGWKHDCHGKWYKDENVEFDSDEEDPNVCLG